MSKLQTDVWYLPRPATDYPGCYPQWFERRIPEILQIENDNFIHLFAGKTTSGFKVDVNSSVAPDLVSDVHGLPLESEMFDGAMADPPYTPEFAETLYGTEYPKWGMWTKEMARVVKPGKLIAVMHNYIVPQIAGCKMERIIVILTRIKQYPKIVTIQRKH